MKKLLLIFLLAVVLRLVLYVAMQPQELETYDRMPDAANFMALSQNLYESKIFSSAESPPLVKHIRRTPVFPLFAAGVYSMAGLRPDFVLLAQVIISAAFCLFTYRLGALVFDARAGLLAATLHACAYSSIIYASSFTADTLLAGFVALHAYYLIRFFRDGERRMLVLAAVFLALSALTKPVTIYLVVFLFPLFWFHRRSEFSRTLKSWSLLTAVFLLVISPWIARNYHAHGRLILSTQQDRVIRWHLPSLVAPTKNRNKKSSATNHPIEKEEKPQEAQGGPDEQLPEEERHAARDAFHYATGAIRYFFVVGSSSLPRVLGLQYETVRNQTVRRQGMSAAVQDFLQRKTSLEWAVFCSVLLFLIVLNTTALYATCLELIHRRRTVEIGVLVTICVYFALAVGSVAKSERYRVPILPVIVVLSSYGILQLLELSKRRRAP